MLVLITCMKINDVLTTLPCRIENGTVHLTFNFSSNKHLIHNGSRYFVRTKNLDTNFSADHTRCVTDIHGKLTCSIWKTKGIVDNHYYIPYLLEVIDANNNIAVWSNKKKYFLKKEMFHCFANHGIKRLKLALNNNGGGEVRWSTYQWDEKYKLIEHYTITRGKLLVINNYRKDGCTRLCKYPIDIINSAKSEEICIRTYFSASFRTSCIDTGVTSNTNSKALTKQLNYPSSNSHSFIVSYCVDNNLIVQEKQRKEGISGS